MKSLFAFIVIGLISCCSAKKTADVVNNNNADTATTVFTNSNNYESDTSVPACVKKLIVQFQQEDKQSPPRSIYSYTYNDKLVFFVPAICCDFFSDLYDSSCTLIAHPDGGFTGRGNGKAADFLQTRTGEKLIWKDER